MMREVYANLKEGFIRFIKREPFYLLLIFFIVFVNLLVFFASLDQEKDAGKRPQEPSKTEQLIAQKDQLKNAVIEDRKMSIIASSVMMGIAALILIGFFLDFALFVRKTDGKEIVERSHSPPVPKWDMWDALKVIILFLFFGYVIMITESFLISIFPFLKENDTIISIANTTIMDLIGITVVFYFAIRQYGHKIADLGLSLKNFLKNVSYGILGYISLLPVLLCSLFITTLLISIFRYEPQPQPIFSMFIEEEKLSILTYLTFFVAIVGPIMEEVFFRGFLYSAIKKEVGIKLAIVISAVLFSVLHAHVVGFLPIFILGVFAAYLYEKTGSLIAPITVHITHNLIMVSFIFLIKGIPN